MSRRSVTTSGTRPFPFIKWAGGKSQLLEALLNHTPAEFTTYHEPFLGGGALFFELWARSRIRSAVLNDLNSELITAYRVIKENLPSVVCELRRVDEGFRVAVSQESYYYEVRSRTPASADEVAARFIFLNKTGYNGLYRVNQKGGFNVPFGRYIRPNIFDEKNLHAVSTALQGAELMNRPFQEALRAVRPGDFVYLDPPYQPISKTANFTGYTAGRFGMEDQRALAAEFDRLDRLGARVLLSNSDHDAIGKLYTGKGYHIIEVAANRQINSNPSKRGPVVELLVSNGC